MTVRTNCGARISKTVGTGDRPAVIQSPTYVLLREVRTSITKTGVLTLFHFSRSGTPSPQNPSMTIVFMKVLKLFGVRYYISNHFSIEHK